MQIFLNTYGSSIRIRDGLLSIKKDDKIKKLPFGKLERIYVTKSIQLSSDVLYHCIDNGIDFIITERNGQPIGRIWNNKFGSISKLRKKQLSFSKSSQIVDWVKNQITTKGKYQKELLLCLLSLHEPNAQLIRQTRRAIDEISDKLMGIEAETIEDAAPGIRAYEGQIARRYFKCINAHLPERYRFNKRSRHPARDMTNSMLNYAYGILYSHIESALIKVGLDPYIGFFHRDEYNRPVLTYDVIEVFRPWADWVVFHLCINEVIHEGLFIIDNGAYWLHGDSKRILIQHFVDFFEEVIEIEGKRYSRYTHIDKLAASLASHINETIG